MKLSDYVIDSIAAQGVTHIFEVCGGALSHLLDSLYGRTDITTVSMHHEMAASIAAEGYARISKYFGVAMATSGPGATNLITGIGSCYFDSIPCLFITGQVNTYEYKFEKRVRQIGFQETDIVSIVKPIVKKSVLVNISDEIRYILYESFDLIKDGRPGPFLLDIPLNIQRSDINPSQIKSYTKSIQKSSQLITREKIKEISNLIQNSSRPVILAGGGVRLSDACDELFQFVQISGIPVVTSLMGLDAFPHDDKLHVGMIGTYGNRYANLTIANADLIIALGTRFDTRQTGTKPETFARQATIVHVDIDPLELNNKKPVSYPIQADIRDFLRLMLQSHVSNKKSEISGWLNTIASYKKQYPNYHLSLTDNIDPNYFFHILSEVLDDNEIFCIDVGQIQMWAAQSIQIKKKQRLLTEGGMASIGSALPLAIGASFAQPDTKIISINGDGGFQLNIQELQTIFHHNLPIKIILLNNHGYGMIKQFQEQYMDSRFQSSGIGYSAPDFVNIVSAYKIPAYSISQNDEIIPMLQKIFADNNPVFLEVIIDETTKVSPKLSVNRPVEDQEPLLSRAELKSNMVIELLDEVN